MAGSVLKSAARHLIAFLPWKGAILRRGASLPPVLRSAASVKFLSEIANATGVSVDLDSNLGIDRALRGRIASSKPDLAFGKPKLLIGERSSLDLTRALLQHCECFLDVGSNIGLYVFYLRFSKNSCGRFGSKPIYFFEPDPTLFEQLEDNVSRNRLHNVGGFQVAIGNKKGKVIFFRNVTCDSMGTLVKNGQSQHPMEPIEVDQISFDEFAIERRLKNICAKVDVEGAEELFFDGARKCMADTTYLIIEILAPAIERSLPLRLMRDGKFHAYYINDYNLEHSQCGEFTYVHPFYNWLFCKESPSELRDRLKGSRFRVRSVPAHL
jgi:FkbM family methyltransferase